MAKNNDSAGIGALLIPILLASVAAVLMAVAGFVFGIFLCGRLLTGELTEWGLIVGPASALLFGVTTFVVVFRGFIHYGDPPSSVG